MSQKCPNNVPSFPTLHSIYAAYYADSGFVRFEALQHVRLVFLHAADLPRDTKVARLEEIASGVKVPVVSIHALGQYREEAKRQIASLMEIGRVIPTSTDLVVEVASFLRGEPEKPPIRKSDLDPKDDPELISLAAAADFYNIPKGTLSKRAQKSPGDLGYLRSVQHGRFRYFWKKDLEKIARSRPDRGLGKL